MSKSTKMYQSPTHEEIAACAHRIYEMEGHPQGKQMEHWLQAEAQLVAERKAQAGLMPGKAAATTAESTKETWQAPRRQTTPQNGTTRSTK